MVNRTRVVKKLIGSNAASDASSSSSSLASKYSSRASSLHFYYYVRSSSLRYLLHATYVGRCSFRASAKKFLVLHVGGDMGEWYYGLLFTKKNPENSTNHLPYGSVNPPISNNVKIALKRTIQYSKLEIQIAGL